MLAIAIALDPKLAALPGSDEFFLAGVVQGSGATPQPVTLAGGQQVPYIAPAGGPKAIMVSEGALHVLFLGDDAQQAQELRQHLRRGSRVTPGLLWPERGCDAVVVFLSLQWR
jgi:hypothetical protein